MVKQSVWTLSFQPFFFFYSPIKEYILFFPNKKLQEHLQYISN